MARYTEHQRDLIDSAVEQWKSRCLLDDQPLFFADSHTLWSTDNVDDLHRRFNENPLVGDAAGGRFFTKQEEQLKEAPSDIRRVLSEVMFVYVLFSSSMTSPGKKRVIVETLQDSEWQIPAEMSAVFGQGIGNPGPRFNLRRDLQVGYLIDFVHRFKHQTMEYRQALLDNPWQLRDFADDTDWPASEMRHILLHLLRPDEFERMSSGTHKRQIAVTFAGFLAENAPDDVDEKLLLIRKKLAGFLGAGGNTGGGVDFYHRPLYEVWGSSSGAQGEGVGDIEALLWKRQIVLYGPPGTSKTWQAVKLAEAVIRQQALRRWGPTEYFARADTVEQALQDNIFRLQLHPGYGYEQFIRGLRLEGDVTRYRPGYLPHVVAKLESQHLPDDLAPLPGVLILDEINRTNLTEMLGEAFSLLERDQRGKQISLPGFDVDQTPDVLKIPKDFYVIGTMNEIDQSVDSLDFALRRRFLWLECPFDPDALRGIVEHRWTEDVERRFKLDEATYLQLQHFADKAALLNAAITKSPELGRQYEIGHTYFADITFFIGAWSKTRKARPAHGTYLWDRSGNATPPMIDLWRRSLEPLLQQYLAGSDVREDELGRFEQIFLANE